MPVPGSSTKATASTKHLPAMSSDNVLRVGPILHYLKWVMVRQHSPITLPPQDCPEGPEMAEACWCYLF